jgi:hypothetical protein
LRALIASKINVPMPGRAKITSAKMAPPSSRPMPSPRTASVGMHAFLSAYLNTTRRSEMP